MQTVSAIRTDLVQERRLVTPIPGPKSVALHERRQSAVASGVEFPQPDRASAATAVTTRARVRIGPPFRPPTGRRPRERHTSP